MTVLGQAPVQDILNPGDKNPVFIKAPSWRQWFTSLRNAVTPASGPTSARPSTTGLPVGYTYFDTTLGLPVTWTGTIWLLGGNVTQTALVSGSNATTTGQVLVDITGLVLPLAANETYELEAILSCGVSAVTTGNQYGVKFSAAGAGLAAQISGSFTSTAAKVERISVLEAATSAFLTTSAQFGGILIKGIITTGANAGNLSIQHLKVTSGTSTVFINSQARTTRRVQ